MLAIVVSRPDRASAHIGEHLLDLVDWEEHVDASRPDADGGGTYYRRPGVELREFGTLHLDTEDAAAAFGDGDSAPGSNPDSAPDLLVFVSKHSGETGPLLSAHFTGNFGPADYGGDPGALARACPNAQAAVVDALGEYAPDGYEVGIECTHHGPSAVGAPSMFVELGSGPDEWADPAGARAVARAVLDLPGVDPDRERQLVGFGGGHYAKRFERVLRETDWAVGHVGADWPLEAMGDPSANRETVARAFDRSATGYALFDGDRPDLAAVVEDLGHRVVSETWVRESVGVPLALVEKLESALVPVDEGLRFGAPAREGTDGGPSGVDLDSAFSAIAVVDLPDALLAEASGIDAEAALAAVRRHALAFETEEAGTRAAGRAAFRDPADRGAVVDDLLAVLDRKYDAVEREGDEVVARTRGFDPEKARTLGVPEGPAFGRLANGDPVEVNGERIDPEVVRSERVERFPV